MTTRSTKEHSGMEQIAIKQTHEEKLKRRAQKHWKRSKRYEKAAKIGQRNCPSKQLPDVDEENTGAKASLLLQLRTGHIALNKHLHRIIKKTESPLCPACGTEEEDNTTLPDNMPSERGTPTRTTGDDGQGCGIDPQITDGPENDTGANAVYTKDRKTRESLRPWREKREGRGDEEDRQKQ